MASVETRSPTSCPVCGAQTEQGQLVCLECGSRVALGYHRPPDWRVAVAVLAGVLLLAVAVTVVALKRVGHESDREVARTPIKATGPKGAGAKRGQDSAGKQRSATTGDAARRPAGKKPAEVKRPAARKPTARKETPARASGGELVKRGALYEWPRELRAFTVVLLSAEDRGSAERFARSASKGMPARIGVLRADDFKSLPQGFFVVFAGRYKDRPAAERAAARLGKRFSGSFPQLVAR